MPLYRDDPEFRELMDNAGKDGSVDAYFQLRIEYPWHDVDTVMGHLRTNSAVYELNEECKKYGFREGYIASALAGDFVSIDYVSMGLIDLIFQKEDAEADNETALVRRGLAIPDSIVDYLVVQMMDAITRGRKQAPISLAMLLRKRLGVGRTNLDRRHESERSKIRVVAAAYENKNEQGLPSYRQLEKLTGISAGHITRMFRDESLAEWVEKYAKWKGARIGPTEG